MVELQWRSLTTLFYTFTIATAGTLAAAHYCSLLHNHCAISPYSGTEHSWGISLTQDSRDSDFYSGCHSNRGEGFPPGKFEKCIFRKFCKCLAGSFSAVSKRNFARKYASDSIFQALQDLHTFAPLQSQNFSKKKEKSI